MNKAVSIWRDEKGIPHVKAKNLVDMFGVLAIELLFIRGKFIAVVEGQQLLCRHSELLLIWKIGLPINLKRSLLIQIRKSQLFDKN